MDVFPDTQLLHGGLSTRLPCKSMEQMHCPGGTVHFSFSCPGGYFTIDFDFSNSPKRKGKVWSEADFGL